MRNVISTFSSGPGRSINPLRGALSPPLSGPTNSVSRMTSCPRTPAPPREHAPTPLHGTVRYPLPRQVGQVREQSTLRMLLRTLGLRRLWLVGSTFRPCPRIHLRRRSSLSRLLRIPPPASIPVTDGQTAKIKEGCTPLLQGVRIRLMRGMLWRLLRLRALLEARRGDLGLGRRGRLGCLFRGEKGCI